MMWSNRCPWNRVIKCGVSLVFVALVLLITLPMTRAPQIQSGGVQLVSLEGGDDLVGPTMQAGATPYEVYVPQFVPKKSVIVEPTPTPEPVWVYANDGGEYYHTKKCKYVKENTPKVTLIQAADAGFKQCKQCKPFTIMEVYGDTYS
ncbi:hypothetical protein LJC33_02305 [Eubacteriales bacterium OttesenSCG-928-N13]|nr:hypothetical protein [Eubacteriales bacterium OttesenSCG-928-N13]